MSHQHLRPALFALALLVIAAALLIPAPVPAQSAKEHQVYLPLLRSGINTRSVFGLEMLRLAPHRGLDLLTATDTRWVRRNALLWKDIEPQPNGNYNWEAAPVKEMEQELIRASQLGINYVMIIRGSPNWAVSPHKSGCAPINPNYYGDFARFLSALVQRYSVPPYNLRFIEIGNEPDAPIKPVDSVFGCWGVERENYFGGEAYGTMLKTVVPAIKAANPNVLVLNGGLLLDQPYVAGKSTTRLGRFFEGMLRAGAGPYIDIVSFHTYTYWRTPGQPPLGPAVDWRIKYLQDLLKDYGQPVKPMLRTETALLCVTITPECRWAQADLVARTYARTMRDQLLGTIWYIYDDDGFHNTALIEPYDVFVPRPAYFAYRHAAQVFNNASYEGPIPELPAGVEGYAFRKDGGLAYVYWTDSGSAVPFTIAVRDGAAVRCTDRDGGPMACAAEGGVLALTAETSPAFAVVR